MQTRDHIHCSSRCTGHISYCGRIRKMWQRTERESNYRGHYNHRWIAGLSEPTIYSVFTQAAIESNNRKTLSELSKYKKFQSQSNDDFMKQFSVLEKQMEHFIVEAKNMIMKEKRSMESQCRDNYDHFQVCWYMCDIYSNCLYLVFFCILLIIILY